MGKFLFGTESDQIGIALCEQLGIDSESVRRIVIDLEVGSAAKIYYETFADDEKLHAALAGRLLVIS